MGDTWHTRFNLPDRTYQASVRAELRKIAELGGFTGHRLGEFEIIIAEITSNLVKFANSTGFVLCRLLEENGGGLEIISIDGGPGIASPKRMMEDGHSSTSSLGQGLGAIRRLSDEFDLYSLPGWGTIVFSRIFKLKSKPLSTARTSCRMVSVCKRNEKICGDGWYFAERKGHLYIALFDGLGHGVHAHAAVQSALKAFASKDYILPADALKWLHENIRATRGVVATAVNISIADQKMLYCGVGNIITKIVNASKAQGCISYNGIIGHIMPGSIGNHATAVNIKTDLLIMHTDGLTSRWDIQKYPGILQHNPIMISAALYKDADRGNDDATVLTIKFNV